MSAAATQYPACSNHSEHDENCTPCYFRREHAENQTNPKASGHVCYPIRRCEDCIQQFGRKEDSVISDSETVPQMDAYLAHIAPMTTAELIAERANMTRCIQSARRCGNGADVWRLTIKRDMVSQRIAAH